MWIVWLSTIPVFGLLAVLGIGRSQTLTIAIMVAWFALWIIAVFRTLESRPLDVQPVATKLRQLLFN
jgi:hypothetical protein